MLIAFCHLCVSRECTTGNIPDVNFFCMPKYFCHMAESTSGEDQVNPVFWLATCTIPERVRGADLAWNFSPWSCKQNYKSLINQACLVKMTSNFFLFLLTLILSCWTARLEQILLHDQQLIKPFYIAKSKKNDPHSHSTNCKSVLVKAWSQNWYHFWVKTALKLCIWQGICSVINMWKGTTFLRR